MLLKYEKDDFFITLFYSIPFVFTPKQLYSLDIQLTNAFP